MKNGFVKNDGEFIRCPECRSAVVDIEFDSEKLRVGVKAAAIAKANMLKKEKKEKKS